jgi:peptidoglycan/LPS O-acetylase OafA/YrhL
MVQLDALRCFAVASVLVTHALQPSPLPWIFDNLDPGHSGVRLSWRLFERPINDLKRHIVYGAPDPALAFQPGSGAAR